MHPALFIIDWALEARMTLVHRCEFGHVDRVEELATNVSLGLLRPLDAHGLLGLLEAAVVAHLAQEPAVVYLRGDVVVRVVKEHIVEKQMFAFVFAVLSYWFGA